MNIEKDIDTILLDMDGTLLDLHYDHHLWMHYIPNQYAKKHNVSLELARAYLLSQYEQITGKLNWYCYDHWSEALDLDIYQLQHGCAEKIQLRADTLWFLQKLQKLGKRVIMLTNAHPSGLAMKMQKFDLSSYFEFMLSSHDYQLAKEQPLFWQKVKTNFELDLSRCLFIDDNEKILAMAQQQGVGHLCGIATPDTQKPAQTMQAFDVVDNFKELF